MAALDARLVPLKRGHPILGNLPEFSRDALQALVDGWKECGDTVRFRAPVSYLLAHPDAVKTVLVDHHRNYIHPPDMARKLGAVIGNGLVVNEGAPWLRQRRLMQPAFHRQRIAAFAGIMTQRISEMLDSWEAPARHGTPLEMTQEMSQLALGILAQTMFSTDWSAHADAMSRAVHTLDEHTRNRMVAPVDLPQNLPLPAHRRFAQARALVDKIVCGLIAERRAGRMAADDLLAMLIEARDEETGEVMNDEQLRDEVVTMFIAGHETVATALTWTLYLLWKHPEARERVKAEVDGALGGRVPTADDVPQLPYTTMVIREAMRLYPPLWIIVRSPLEDDEVCGYRIPAGKVVALSPYVTHRHPEFWSNPEEFDPERFTPEHTAQRPRCAYFPFSAGPKLCIGESFALMEMQLVLAMLAQRFLLSLLPGHRVEPEGVISLVPRFGMQMTVHPRDQV